MGRDGFYDDRFSGAARGGEGGRFVYSGVWARPGLVLKRSPLRRSSHLPPRRAHHPPYQITQATPSTT